MTNSTTPEERVTQLLAEYDADEMVLAELLCDRHPAQNVAFTIIDPDLSSTDLTYGELSERSKKVAAALVAMGVQPGDRVATLMGKSEAYVETVLGLWRAGAVHVPLFTAFAPAAIALRLMGSDTKIVITDPDQSSKLEPGEDMPADAPWQTVIAGQIPGYDTSDPAEAPVVTCTGSTEFVRLFTSGTTGDPKGVPIPVRAIASFQTYLEYGLYVTEDDVFWNAADPGWAYGLYYAIITPMAAGRRSLLLHAGFSPELTWKVASTFGVTNLAAAPTVFRSLRSAGLPIPEDLAIRRMTSAGEPLNPEMVTWAEQTLGTAIHDTYGQTELGMCGINGWHPDVAGPVQEGSMGRPQPGWTMTVLKNSADEIAEPGESGRIAVDLEKTPAMWFTGYVDAPEKTAERFSRDGRWYITGDAGRRDEDGYIYFAARADDVIIMAGYRISPFEVESVLVGDPNVVESAVIGVPDELRGEVVEAYVVLKPGVQGDDALVASLQQRVKNKLAAHVFPRRIHFVDELPKTPSGKIQRFVLRERAAG